MVEFRDAAVRQVIDGEGGMSVVARSLEISSKTLRNSVYRAREGQLLLQRNPALPTSELEAQVSRLRRVNALLTMAMLAPRQKLPTPTTR